MLRYFRFATLGCCNPIRFTGDQKMSQPIHLILIVTSLCAALIVEPTAAADYSQILGNIAGQVAQKNGGSAVASVVRQTVQTITKPTPGSADLRVFGGLGQGAQGGLPDGNNIVIYSAEWCPVCRQALSYLNSRQINYVLNDIEHNPAAKAQFDELLRTRQARGVPMVYVGAETMNGWSVSGFDAMYKRFEAHKAKGQGTATAANAPPNPSSSPVTWASGDVLVTRIAGTRLLAAADSKAAVVATLKKRDEVVYTGEQSGSFVRVQGATETGWIDSMLVGKP
jgi:glutaredoxin